MDLFRDVAARGVTFTPEVAPHHRQIVRVSLTGANVIPDALVALEESDDVTRETGWCMACASDSDPGFATLAPSVPTLPGSLTTQIVRWGSIELRLQNLSSGPDSNGRQEDTVIKGTVSRMGKPEYIYFIATLRASSIVSLDLFETAARDGYVSGSVSMVPLQSTGTSLVPLLFLSCYVSDMLDGRGLCR